MICGDTDSIRNSDLEWINELFIVFHECCVVSGDNFIFGGFLYLKLTNCENYHQLEKIKINFSYSQIYS